MKIEGYFSNMKTANDTISKLKDAGFKNSIFDINDSLSNERNMITNFAGAENGESLSDLVLGSGSTSFLDRTKAPIAAANPAVSGMGPMEEIADINCKVVVEVTKENVDEAKKIIASMGGDFTNPEIIKPEIVGDEDKVFDISMDRLKRNI